MEMVNDDEKMSRKIIDIIVIIASNKLVLRFKFDDEKILGIIKKIAKGLIIPPVK